MQGKCLHKMWVMEERLCQFVLSGLLLGGIVKVRSVISLTSLMCEKNEMIA